MDGRAPAVEDQVLVHLVGDDDRVVPLRESDDVLQHGAVEDGAGGVVRVVDQDDAGAVGHRGRQLVEVRLEVRPPQRDRHQACSGERDQRGVGVVVGLEDDDLVVGGVDEGQQRRRQSLGRPGGRDDLGRRVERDTVEPAAVLGDSGKEVGKTPPRRILIHSVGDRLPSRLAHDSGPVLVGEALPEVDRVRFGRQHRHLGEDGGGGDAVRAHETGASSGAAPRAGNLSHRAHATRIEASHLRHRQPTDSLGMVVSARQKEQQ